MTAIFSTLPSITDSQTWFYIAGAIGAITLAIGFLAAAASLIFGWRMNAEQKSATQVEIANVESAAHERIEIETTKVRSAAEERIAKVESESREKIAELTAASEVAKKERAEADKEIAIAKADATRAKEGIANAEAQSSKASAEVARLQVVVANAEQKRADAERALLEVQERIKPRHLTAEQRARLLANLTDGPKGEVTVQISIGDDEARDFAVELWHILSSAGWKVKDGGQNVQVFAKNLGLVMHASGSERVPVAAPSEILFLKEALESVGLHVGLVASEHAPKDAVIFFIGPKP